MSPVTIASYSVHGQSSLVTVVLRADGDRCSVPYRAYPDHTTESTWLTVQNISGDGTDAM